MKNVIMTIKIENQVNIEKLITRQSNFTTNYNQFHYLKGNRYGGSSEQGSPSDSQKTKFEKKVKTLIKSMAEEGFDRTFAIEVAIIDGYLVLLDGQHRLEAAKRLGIEIPFDILPHITTYQQAEAYCRRKNNNRSSIWDIIEHFYSKINSPLDPEMSVKYSYIKSLSDSYGVGLAYVCDIAVCEGSTKTNGVIRQDSYFDIKADIENIMDFAQLIAERSHYDPKVLMSSRAFVRCVARMYRHPNFTQKLFSKVLNEPLEFNLREINRNDHVLSVLQNACNKYLHNKQITLFDSVKNKVSY